MRSILLLLLSIAIFFFFFLPPWNERQVMDGVIFSLGFFLFFTDLPDFFFGFLFTWEMGLICYRTLISQLYYGFFPFLSLLLPFYHRAATFFSFSLRFLYSLTLLHLYGDRTG